MDSVTYTTTQPRDLIDAVRTHAGNLDETLSGYTGEALRRRLPAEIRAKLSERPICGRPKGTSVPRNRPGRSNRVRKPA